MDLPDLHLHLDGSLRPSTLARFAQEDGLRVPPDILFSPGMGLERALSCFGFTLGRLTTPAPLSRQPDLRPPIPAPVGCHSHRLSQVAGVPPARHGRQARARGGSGLGRRWR